MLYTLLIAGVLLVVIVMKYMLKPAERCPECGQKRGDDAPICTCGYVFEFPEDSTPLEYGAPEDVP